MTENGLDVSEAEVDAALAAWWDYRRGNFGSTPKGQMRAALEAALARRLPPADNAVAVDTISESKCEYCGDLNWEGPSNHCRTSSGHSWRSTGRTLYVYTATPSYAEGRAAGLREALAAAREEVPVIIGARTEGAAIALQRLVERIEALIGAAP